jgi:dTDP-4-dehydrorhamnose 3,5-epimerase
MTERDCAEPSFTSRNLWADRITEETRGVHFTQTRLGSVYLIDLERRVDERGFFARTFCEGEFAAHGLPTRFPQCNLSRNRRSGTLRGMHFQAAAHREAKVVRCVSGAIYDAIVDLRPDSPTYRQSIGVELSAESGRALFVPEGFAHGFITLVDDVDVFYHMSNFFHAESARGFRWNDPFFKMEWPSAPTIISGRDATYQDFDPATFDG